MRDELVNARWTLEAPKAQQKFQKFEPHRIINLSSTESISQLLVML
jgi:hypothetical protein